MYYCRCELHKKYMDNNRYLGNVSYPLPMEALGHAVGEEEILP